MEVYKVHKIIMKIYQELLYRKPDREGYINYFNALMYKKTIIEELQLVLIHGLLHLVGFSHQNEDRLKKIENEILAKVWKDAK